jgi:hypothetical protein
MWAGDVQNVHHAVGFGVEIAKINQGRKIALPVRRQIFAGRFKVTTRGRVQTKPVLSFLLVSQSVTIRSGCKGKE